ncbi:MAG: hypothetical protein JOZ84_05765 [Methylobacteriaceae bacterium]|nr:hypothetical protein [Methylobacteriaceae bacterium]MBV9393902.1 hypothetical protein [Methylobacteriaceae bacterium]
MSLKLFSIGGAAVLAAAAAFFAVQTVGYANGGLAPAMEQPAEATHLTAAPIQIDLPAGWSKVPALQNEGALYALRCEAKGCIPGVTATLSCVPAAGPHDGAGRELVSLAGERPAVGGNSETLTSAASVLTVHGREFHERSAVLNNGRYVVTAAARLGDDVCGIGLTGPRSEGARLDLTIRSMLSRLRFS